MANCSSCLLGTQGDCRDIGDVPSGQRRLHPADDNISMNVPVVTRWKGINLDTTSFVALCSELTYDFEHVMLSLPDEEKKKRKQQLEDESANPGRVLEILKPILDNQDHPIYVSDCVTRELETIVRTTAGRREAARSRELMQRATIFSTEDVLKDFVSKPSSSKTEKPLFASHEGLMSNVLSHLKPTGRIRERHLRIFGQAERMRLVSFTSDAGFLRASKSQGIDLEKLGLVISHYPRSYTGL